MEWEQESEGGGKLIISSNRTLQPLFKELYEFQTTDPWDFSISINEFPSNELRMLCLVISRTSEVIVSFWSNITVQLLPSKYGIGKRVLFLTNTTTLRALCSIDALLIFVQ